MHVPSPFFPPPAQSRQVTSVDWESRVSTLEQRASVCLLPPHPHLVSRGDARIYPRMKLLGEREMEKRDQKKTRLIHKRGYLVISVNAIWLCSTNCPAINMVV